MCCSPLSQKCAESVSSFIDTPAVSTLGRYIDFVLLDWQSKILMSSLAW